jgi:hypothetical protein
MQPGLMHLPAVMSHQPAWHSPSHMLEKKQPVKSASFACKNIKCICSLLPEGSLEL